MGPCPRPRPAPRPDPVTGAAVDQVGSADAPTDRTAAVASTDAGEPNPNPDLSGDTDEGEVPEGQKAPDAR